MKSFRFLIAIFVSTLLVTGDGFLSASLFAKSRYGGYSKPSYSSRGYSKPSYSSRGSNWSGATKDTWNRSGGGIFGGSSSGYSKPGVSRIPLSKPPSGYGGSSGYSKPSLGGYGGSSGYSKPSLESRPAPTLPSRSGYGSGGYGKPSFGGSSSDWGSRDRSPKSGYFKPSLDDRPGKDYPRPSPFRTPQSSGYAKPSSEQSPSAFGSRRSGSSGYSKPTTPGTASRRPSGLSSMDQQAINQDRKRRSAESLARYRTEQSRFKNPPVDANQNFSNNSLYQKSKVYSGFDYNTYQNRQDGFFKNQGYRPPVAAFGGSPSFGVFNALFLYYMLDHMKDKNVAAAAYHNWDDPGFKKWREEVEKQSKDNAELKAKLAEMEKQVQQFQGTPREPGNLPPGVPPEVAVAPNVLAGKKAEEALLRLATGKPGGWYDKLGSLLKKDAKNLDIQLTNTSGSIENLKLLAEGKVDMAMIQSDVLAMMQPGKKLISEQSELYPEYAQLIANRKSGIKSVKDINPKKHIIFVGPKESGTALTWQAITEQSAWYRRIPVKYGDYSEGLAEVERNPNVVMLFVGGLGSDFLKKAEQAAEKSRNLRLVQFDDRRFASLRDAHGNRIYKLMEIPSSVYPELQRGWIFSGSVDTLAVQAVLVLRSDWVQKFGPEAMDELSIAVNKMKPEIRKLVMNK